MPIMNVWFTQERIANHMVDVWDVPKNRIWEAQWTFANNEIYYTNEHDLLREDMWNRIWAGVPIQDGEVITQVGRLRERWRNHDNRQREEILRRARPPQANPPAFTPVNVTATLNTTNHLLRPAFITGRGMDTEEGERGMPEQAEFDDERDERDPFPPMPGSIPTASEEFKEEDYPDKGLLTMRPTLEPFNVKYTADEVVQRFRGTLITINNTPFMITEIQTGKAGDLIAYIRDSKGKGTSIPWKKITNLRSIQPGYTPYRPFGAMFLLRLPVKDVYQGLSRNNAKIIKCGAGYENRKTPDLFNLLEGLGRRKPRRYKPELLEMMEEGEITTYYLSPELALYWESGEMKCEYRGRTLGSINRGSVVVPEKYLCLPMLREDCDHVNLGVQS